MFVSHTYPPYIQNSTTNIRRTRRAVEPDGSPASRAVSWVNVNTKTRSKKSSRVVTRSSSSPVLCRSLAGRPDAIRSLQR